MKKQFKWIWYAQWLIIALVGGGGTLFSWMPRTAMMFYGGCAMLILAVVLGVTLLMVAREKTWKKALVTGAISGAVYGALIAAIVYVCDELLFKDMVREYEPVHSSIAVVILSIAFTVALVVLMPKKYDPKLVWLKRAVAAVLCITALVLSGLPQNWWWGRHNEKVAGMQQVTSPTGFSTHTAEQVSKVEDADYYVAIDGDDANDGSIDAPFASIEKARDVIRALDKTGRDGITVAIKAGDYSVAGLTFTAEDSGTKECPIVYTAYGDGEVIFNAGVTLQSGDFAKVSDEATLERLQDSVEDKIYYIDLGKLGITAEDYGKLYAIGAYNYASQYDGDYVGPQYAELFINDSRQTIARYPNEGWLGTGAIVDLGQPRSFEGEDIEYEVDWYDLRNPQPTTYAMDKELAERLKGWQLDESIWMFGYWYYDWADGATPFGEADFDAMTITPKFVCGYGAKEGANYYFYNVLEELDAEGEWYLDRENAILYIYEPENMEEADIKLSLSLDNIIKGEDVDYLTFSRITFQGTRSDAVAMTGDNNTVEYCIVKNVGGNAIVMDGYNNLVANNDISHTGKGGIVLKGGVQETLTAGNNRAYNNLIHDYSEIYATYQPAVYLQGVGNTCDHNEIYNAPHEAIQFAGNNHMMEYNIIHDVCKLTDDGGAIYAGRRWDWYGNTIRYNAIYDLGTPGHYMPTGIYYDDGLAGQNVYGNLLVNVPDIGIKLGGGRDYICKNNIIINTVRSSIRYMDSLYVSGSDNIDDTILPNLALVPWESELWQNAFPALKGLFWDTEKADDPLFWGNCAGSEVNGNIVVSQTGELGEIASNPSQYSDISGNAVYGMDMLEQIFTDPDNGDYSIKEGSPIYEIIPDFEEIPYDKIGRE